jgi:hypothetical protein
VRAIVLAAIVVASLGCESDDERLANFVESSNRQQAEQNVAVAENTRAIAEGSRTLVSADAEARRELIEFQRDLRTDQSDLGRQREEFDQMRREQLDSERRESLLAPAIVTLGLLIACVTPLVLAGFAINGLFCEPTQEEAEYVLSEFWLELDQSESDAMARVTHADNSRAPRLD